jgi:hypothetical protein
MSVIRQDDEMMMFVNELESKVLILIEHNKQLNRRVKVLESAAKKYGVDVNSPDPDKDVCTIV